MLLWKTTLLCLFFSIDMITFNNLEIIITFPLLAPIYEPSLEVRVIQVQIR